MTKNNVLTGSKVVHREWDQLGFEPIVSEFSWGAQKHDSWGDHLSKCKCTGEPLLPKKPFILGFILGL